MVTLLQEGMSFTFNFKDVADRTMVTRVLMRVAAKNSFALGPFSEYAYLGEPDANVIVKCNVSIDAACLIASLITLNRIKFMLRFMHAPL